MQGGKIQLGYWSIRGLAERIRMFLEYTGLEYEEIKYTDHAKWFGEDKPNFTKKNPAINLPYLHDGDKVISESDAIMVYIAHRSGKPQLLGRNADEQVGMATAMGVERDLHSKYINLVYGRYADKTFEEAKAEHVEVFKPFLSKLNGLLEGRQYYAGEITWVDFAIAEFIQCLWLLENKTVEDYPNVWAHQKRIWELPAIKAYHESGRFQERPVNSPQFAKWF